MKKSETSKKKGQTGAPGMMKTGTRTRIQTSAPFVFPMQLRVVLGGARWGDKVSANRDNSTMLSRYLAAASQEEATAGGVHLLALVYPFVLAELGVEGAALQRA